VRPQPNLVQLTFPSSPLRSKPRSRPAPTTLKLKKLMAQLNDLPSGKEPQAPPASGFPMDPETEPWEDELMQRALEEADERDRKHTP